MINPCDACINTYDIKDINNINQCCSNTYSAFAKVSSINNVKDLESFKNCEQCIQKSIESLGRDKCDFRLTSYPVWTQSPHYFPTLYNETNNVEIAKNKCLEMCDKSGYPNECKQNCIIDSRAIVTKENFLKDPVSTTTYTPINSPKPYNKHHNEKKINKLQFFLSFTLGSVIFSIIIVLFLKIMIKK